MELMNMMDPDLEDAAVKGNVEILKQRLADCQTYQYFSDIMSRSVKKHEEMGTILHLAAWNVQVEFFKEAINDLSNHQLVEKLVCHQEWSGDYLGYNPLHVAAYMDSPEMVQAIIGYYKNNPSLEGKPWLAKDSKGLTPLHIALQLDRHNCALEMLSFDIQSLCDSVDDSGNSPLFLAVRKGHDEVAKRILDSAKRCRNTGDNGFFTALHFALNCSVDVCKSLLEKNVKSKTKLIDKYKMPILHKWIELQKESKLSMLLDDHENNAIISDDKIRRYLVNLISECDDNKNNGFHILAREQKRKASKILANFHNRHKEDQINDLPLWLKQNASQETPLHLALQHDSNDAFEWLNETYKDVDFKPTEVGPLVRAVQMRKYDFAKQIGETLAQYGWTPFCPHGNKIWQVQGVDRTDVEVAKWLVENLPNLIPEKEAIEALKYASEKGYEWLVERVLKEHPSELKKDPLVWKEACKNGYYDTVVAFIQNYPCFRELCLEENTTPLHHVKFNGYEEYRKFLENPVVKGLRNCQDQGKASPLHHAISNDNIELAEALLDLTDVNLDLKNEEKRTPLQLLHTVSDKEKWNTMCHRYGIIPGFKIHYFRNSNMAHEVRNTLSVVAALLATITFTAGFTIPGGFDQNQGDALLGDKATFMVFIICDAFAMFCSLIMLVLLMLSVIADHARSLVFISISMVILLVALVSTVMAFMTGVYVVLGKKCFGVAITIIVMCSILILLVVISLIYWICDVYKPGGGLKKDVEHGQEPTLSPEDQTTTGGQEDHSLWNWKNVLSCFGVRRSQQTKSD